LWLLTPVSLNSDAPASAALVRKPLSRTTWARPPRPRRGRVGCPSERLVAT
jgi:hypothetical protein